MRNILMLHYDLFFYRIPFYNYLEKELRRRNLILIIWAYSVQKDIKVEEVNFELIDNGNFEINMKNYRFILKQKKINTVINFLKPSQPHYTFYVSMIIYTFFKKIDLIYYGHGLNLGKKNNVYLNIFYNTLHLFYKKIILYTPNERKYLWKVHQNKIEIAFNTLFLDSNSLKKKYFKKYFKKELLIDENSFVVLFSGRIEKRKDLESLVTIFNNYQEQNLKNIELLIIGPGITDDILLEISNNSLIHYLGPMYDKSNKEKVFSASDVFCIPGQFGLGLVEAFFWGLPVLTKKGNNAPEMFYLENGKNGFVLDHDRQLSEKIKYLSLSENRDELKKISINASNTYSKESSPKRMLEGFLRALEL